MSHRNKINTRLAHKQMINDLLDEIKNVFGSDLCLKVEEKKKNSKFTLHVYYSLTDKVFTFRVSHKSVQDRQLVLSVYHLLKEDDESKHHSTAFIGRGETNSKKIYLVELEPAFSNLSLAKLNQKLFTPFGRKNQLNRFDSVKSPFIMVNMNLFFVEEENQTILEDCETSLMTGLNLHTHLYEGLHDLYAYSSLTFEYAVYSHGNYYVKGSVTQSSGQGKNAAGFSRIPSKFSRWRRIVEPDNSSATRWTKSVDFY